MAESGQFQERKNEPKHGNRSNRVGFDEKELEDLFKEFSSYENLTQGTVDLSKLEFIFRCMGFSEDRALELKNEASKIKAVELSRHLTWKHFRNFVQDIPDLPPEWPSHENVKDAFCVFEQEGHGLIHATQLKRFMTKALGNDDDEEKVDELIANACEFLGDDLINYSEFIDYIEENYKKINTGKK